MKYKTCTQCNKRKKTTDFYGVRANCKTCVLGNQKQRLESPIEKANVARRLRRARLERKCWLISLKGGKCSSCGRIYDEICYDFHHIDSSKKEFPIGQLLNYSKKELLKEAEKCIMVCANCHRIIHKESRLALHKQTQTT